MYKILRSTLCVKLCLCVDEQTGALPFGNPWLPIVRPNMKVGVQRIFLFCFCCFFLFFFVCCCFFLCVHFVVVVVFCFVLFLFVCCCFFVVCYLLVFFFLLFFGFFLGGGGGSSLEFIFVRLLVFFIVERISSMSDKSFLIDIEEGNSS